VRFGSPVLYGAAQTEYIILSAVNNPRIAEKSQYKDFSLRSE